MRPVAIFVALATLATPAAAFDAVNGFSVSSTGPQDFAVDYKGILNETAYWCAAGDFVIRDLGLSRKTRIYRASPPPRRAGQGIVFTLDPAAAAAESGLSTFGKDADGSVSAGHARGSFCSIFEDLPFR